MSRKIWLQSLLKLWPIRLCKLHLRSLRVRWVCVSWELLGLCQISPTERVETRQKSDPAGKCFAKRNWIYFGWFGNVWQEKTPLKKTKNTCIQSSTIDESILGHGVCLVRWVFSRHRPQKSPTFRGWRIIHRRHGHWGWDKCRVLSWIIFFNFLKTMIVL